MSIVGNLIPTVLPLPICRKAAAIIILMDENQASFSIQAVYTATLDIYENLDADPIISLSLGAGLTLIPPVPSSQVYLELSETQRTALSTLRLYPFILQVKTADSPAVVVAVASGEILPILQPTGQKFRLTVAGSDIVDESGAAMIDETGKDIIDGSGTGPSPNMVDQTGQKMVDQFGNPITS